VNIPGTDQTSIAQTVAVLQTQLAVQPTVAITSLPTATLEPVAISIPTAALPVPTAAPAATDTPAYKAGNVIDVTYVDKTEVLSGTAFVKTWRIENTGSQTWGTNFKVIFVSGDALGGPASQVLGKSVAPGQTVDISLSLIAPSIEKTYLGYWMLQTESGTKFGIGVNADKPFWVQIVVIKNFVVTAAGPNGPASYTGGCPGNISLTATITSASSGTVTYYFVVNGVNTATLSVPFTAAGTSTTSAFSYTVTTTGPLSIQVYIDTPNHQLFSTTLTIPVTCS
jgi:hypothetical protein